ncbi:MAG TPA: tripartite tricarboxylate transporter substrate binding protein [Usitatibacter sp.]|nr:tripartite tricarboxylate transporter substrate binding protein [Usitatibacter sp.]
MRLARILLCALALCAGVAAAAEPWPAKPVKLVVPYPPGGSTDGLARIFADGLGSRLGQPVIIENKPGAATVIGTDYVAAQAADGYTLLLCTPGLAINPSVYPVHYDPEKSFTYVTLLASLPLILVAHPDVPVANVNDVVALAKSKPGEISYTTYGMGSAAHLAGELLHQMTGAKMLHVPFKGSSPAVTEVIAGRANLSFTTVPMVVPMIKAGRVKPVGVTTAQRLDVLKDVPTIAESLPGFEVVSWNGLCAPAGVSHEIVERLNKASNEVVNAPESRARLVDQGYVVAGGTPEQFRAFVMAEVRKWSKLIREANVKME